MLNQDRKTKFTEQTKSELQEVAVNMTGCWLASCKLSGWHKQKFSCEKQEARSITILMDGITAPCGMFLTSWCKFADMKVTEPSESSPRPRANSISESISSTSQMNGRHATGGWIWHQWHLKSGAVLFWNLIKACYIYLAIVYDAFGSRNGTSDIYHLCNPIS